MTDLKTWFGQVTTGHGATAIGSALLGVATGTLSWQTAIPLLAGGIILLLWPENSNLATQVQAIATSAVAAAPTVLADTRALEKAYMTGVAHGNAAATAAPPAPPASPPSSTP
jgi:hypothetical protein